MILACISLLAADQLNSDLVEFHHWADKWLVTFNPGNSEYVIFSRKYNKPYHHSVLMNQAQIAKVTLVSFQMIVLVKIKAWKRTNIMRKLKFQLDRTSLQTIYFSFIRPLREYLNTVWNNCTQYEPSDSDKIETEAVRIVTGATKLASIDSRHTKIG